MIIGNFPCKKSSEGYSPPADWPNIDSCPDGHIQLILSDTVLATYAFICTTTAGQYRINWGDGTTALYDSGATAEHTYTIGTGQACSRGYTTFVADITAVDAGAGLTGFKVMKHSLATQNQYFGVLGCVMNCATLTSTSYAFCRPPQAVVCDLLEFAKILQANTVATALGMFKDCHSLQSVDISSMTAVTSASNMFCACYSLRDVDVSSMASVTNTSYMFNACHSLQSIDVSSMTAVTTASSMFYDCYSLQNVDVNNMTAVTDIGGLFCNCYALRSMDISGMTAVITATNVFNGCYALRRVDLGSKAAVTNASGIFSNCYSLQEIIGLEYLGSSAVSIDLTTAFTNCEQLSAINLPNAKITKIGAAGASGKLNKITSLTFSLESPFSGTPEQIEVSYCSFDATQLNTLFTNLPTLSGKTIRIAGCPGASTCDRSIATAKGWTVTG